jgi:hypothetical protein
LTTRCADRLVITKLDGTAKGGVLCAIARKSRCRSTSSASAKNSKTWKPSTREFAQALLS